MAHLPACLHVNLTLSRLQHTEEVKKDWKKAAKGDAAVRLAALMDEDGKQGVAAAFEQVCVRSGWHACRRLQHVAQR
jgi:hypothetical protein